ncbi:hypothetical protein DM02DRAFT_327605 [Periconia macrospinosa]|uniref:Uncharacterized protein n=1 Tax=Periconia macrospinosa TaxID=97972 RepID=A0A2V1EDX9_9PLEO|nr:hypothetical protein DM02DRAFT_327605 [Periconia macrospinosa]
MARYAQWFAGVVGWCVICNTGRLASNGHKTALGYESQEYFTIQLVEREKESYETRGDTAFLYTSRWGEGMYTRPA